MCGARGGGWGTLNAPPGSASPLAQASRPPSASTALRIAGWSALLKVLRVAGSTSGPSRIAGGASPEAFFLPPLSPLSFLPPLSSAFFSEAAA